MLYTGLAEAYELAGVHLRRARAPHPGEALDGFVAAYTGAYGVRDTPASAAGRPGSSRPTRGWTATGSW